MSIFVLCQGDTASIQAHLIHSGRYAVQCALRLAPLVFVRAAYNYAEYLPERRRMMQEFSDYLTPLKEQQ